MIPPIFTLLLLLNIYTCYHLNLPVVDRFTHFPVNFMCSFRTFRLHLKHDSEVFSENFTVITENGPISADLSHVYSGILEGGYYMVSVHLNYDGYSLVSSLFLSICFDLNSASVISAF